MSKPTLIYWGIKGQAFPARIALHMAGVDFEDRMIFKIEDWFGENAMRSQYEAKNALANLPCLELKDGTVINQSGAVLRHVARKHDLYGADIIDNARVDEVIGHLEDGWRALGRLPDDKHKFLEAREQFKSEMVTWMYGSLDRYIEKNGTEFSAAKKPTIADAYLIALTLRIAAACDTESSELLKPYPKVLAVYAATSSLPPVAAYLKEAEKMYFNAPDAAWGAFPMPATSS